MKRTWNVRGFSVSVLLLMFSLFLLSSCATSEKAITENPAETAKEEQTASPAWLDEEVFLHFGRMGEDDPCYTDQYETRAYEKMQSYTLCESTADYDAFRELCEEIWPGGDYAAFPALSEEFFAENQLVTLYLPFRANNMEENAEAVLSALWRYGEQKAFLCVDMKIAFDEEEELLPAKNFPTQFGAMLIPMPREEGEIRHVTTTRMAMLNESILASKLHPDIQTQFYRGLFESELFDNQEPDDAVLSYTPEDGLLFPAAYADIPFATNFLLVPSGGCHPRELSEIRTVEEYIAFVNEDYQAFFDDYALMPASEFGGDMADTIGYRIPVEVTPAILAEILKDPRVIAVGGDWKAPNTDHTGSGWVM